MNWALHMLLLRLPGKGWEIQVQLTAGNRVQELGVVESRLSVCEDGENHWNRGKVIRVVGQVLQRGWTWGKMPEAGQTPRTVAQDGISNRPERQQEWGWGANPEGRTRRRVQTLSTLAGTKGCAGTHRLVQPGRPSRCKQIKQEIVPVLGLPVEVRALVQAFQHETSSRYHLKYF